jgi:hypothetical protein
MGLMSIPSSIGSIDRYGWQKEPVEAGVHVNPEQQAGSPLVPHCCGCTEQLPPSEDPVPVKEIF